MKSRRNSGVFICANWRRQSQLSSDVIQLININITIGLQRNKTNRCRIKNHFATHVTYTLYKFIKWPSLPLHASSWWYSLQCHHHWHSYFQTISMSFTSNMFLSTIVNIAIETICWEEKQKKTENISMTCDFLYLWNQKQTNKTKNAQQRQSKKESTNEPT